MWWSGRWNGTSEGRTSRGRAGRRGSAPGASASPRRRGALEAPRTRASACLASAPRRGYRPAGRPGAGRYSRRRPSSDGRGPRRRPSDRPSPRGFARSRPRGRSLATPSLMTLGGPCGAVPLQRRRVMERAGRSARSARLATPRRHGVRSGPRLGLHRARLGRGPCSGAFPRGLGPSPLRPAPSRPARGLPSSRPGPDASRRRRVSVARPTAGEGSETSPGAAAEGSRDVVAEFRGDSSVGRG